MTSERKKEWNRKKWLVAYLIIIVVMVVLFKYIFLFAVVPSGSMEPTVMTNDRIVSYRNAYHDAIPERGDIIVFYSDAKKEHMLKRVIGLSGETVSFVNGKVYINGKKLPEPYLDSTVVTECEETFVVPEDSVFVMGDNRENSYDSRFWKQPYVPYNKIEAKVVAVIPAGRLPWH